MSKYAKAIVAILGAVVTAALAQFPDSQVVQQWGPILSALLTAVGVYVVPNTEEPRDELGAIDVGTAVLVAILVVLVLIVAGVLPVR